YETRLFRFFDTHLRGASPRDEAPVKLFVMGANTWRDEREWPLARAVPTNFFLAATGNARTAAGDGRLDLGTPQAEPPDSYRYDPRAPTPTRGSMLINEGGAFDQRAVEARADVLCYTTEPLGADLEVTGPVGMILWASSSAPTADWAG